MIPFTYVAPSYKDHEKKILAVVKKVLEGGVYILGPEVSSFEKEFARYIGGRYCIGVASGTAAISLAIRALGIQPGEKVIIPANSYPTIFALYDVGVIPVLVDIDPTTYTIDPQKIELLIDKKTRAIIPVHLYGHPADMDPIIKIAKKNKIFVIEDCAQATGSKYRNFRVGSIGDISCFSFYPTKTIGAFGDGGAVVTNNKKLSDKVRLLRMSGEKVRYKSILRGTNSRLDELQAAILRIKLKYLDEDNKKRRAIAAYYRQELTGIKEIVMPIEKNWGYHVYHLFEIRAKKRNALRKYLVSKGIQTGIHYPYPINKQKSFVASGYFSGRYVISERFANEIVSLPLFPQLPLDTVKQVCAAIKAFYE